MGKHKNAAKGRATTQKGTSPTLLSHGGEAGDTGKAVHDLRDDVDLLEERISQIGGPLQDALQIDTIQLIAVHMTSNTRVSTRSPTHEDQMHYCIHFRVTLGKSEVTSPHVPMHGVVH